MKIIVFGGSGFLGSHVADALTKNGHEVVIFDKIKSPYLGKAQSMVVGDILDEKSVRSAMSGCSVVYNFAGLADMEKARMNPVATVQNNILGNAVLLECSRKNKIQRYVFASSVYVYSHLGSFYRASKQSCELFMESYYETYGLKYTILRYGSLYGPRANEHNWIRQILREALADKRITRFGDGEEIREYIHVEDAASLSADILASEYENEYVILSGHQQMKIKDLLAMVKEIFDNKIEIIYKDVDAEGSTNDSKMHYEITPYSFKPKAAKKIIGRHYMDLGQGILSSLNDLYKEHEKHTVHPG